MSTRRGRKASLGDFRPSQVHQHRGARNVRPGARELFRDLRPRLLASRPLLDVVNHPHAKDAKGKPLRVEVLGAPTFRNSLDEDGVLR